MTTPLLTVNDLRVHFNVDGNTLRAVDGVEFELFPGETLALVGESGCGKSTLAKALVGLNPITSGVAKLHGEPITGISRQAMRRYRSKLQLIFQDPYASLNPRFTIAETLGEPLLLHGKATRGNVDQKVCELLGQVGLDTELRLRYPHEFSGGQRQRVCIARALALQPELIVCDEAVSALDISIQAQILNLLRDLQADLGLTYLFISHSLNVVRHIADRIAVMYLGNLVEIGPAEQVFGQPQHPYTRALVSANPLPDPDAPLAPVALKGEPPSPLNPPPGCRFHTRCPSVFEPCSSVVPSASLTQSTTAEHRVWCHLYRDAKNAD